MTHTDPSRRGFLRAGAAALGLAALPQLLRADERAADPFRGFTLAVQSYTFRNFKLEPALQRIQKLGIKHAEFYNDHVPLTSSSDQLKAILGLCKDYDVKPVAFGVHHFSKNHDANKKAFDF